MSLFEIPAVHVAVYVIAGGLLGFGYQKLVGCRTGTCPITSNPYIASIYGAVIGLIFGMR